mgnify:FL=1|jgi:hypothetical protein|tara:strand:- start:446 stop:592 length:147 start_codon:yes stop_codon:yes gene_type:complete
MGTGDSMKFDPISSLSQHTIKKVYDSKSETRIKALGFSKKENSENKLD